jgi:hypothetical protein
MPWTTQWTRSSKHLSASQEQKDMHYYYSINENKHGKVLPHHIIQHKNDFAYNFLKPCRTTAFVYIRMEEIWFTK